MKLLNLICLILLPVTFLSCCGDQDQRLNSKIKSWAPYYPNQEITFTGTDTNTLTFKVQQTNRQTSGHDKVCGGYDIETVETILINQTDPAFQFKIALTQEVLVKLDSYQTQPAAKNLSAMFNSVSEQFVSDDWRDQYVAEVSLNGKTYRNVLHIFANSPQPGTSFLEIYYAQNSGLVAYRDFNGVWYYLQ